MNKELIPTDYNISILKCQMLYNCGDHVSILTMARHEDNRYCLQDGNKLSKFCQSCNKEII